MLFRGALLRFGVCFAMGGADGFSGVGCVWGATIPLLTCYSMYSFPTPTPPAGGVFVCTAFRLYPPSSRLFCSRDLLIDGHSALAVDSSSAPDPSHWCEPGALRGRAPIGKQVQLALANGKRFLPTSSSRQFGMTHRPRARSCPDSGQH